MRLPQRYGTEARAYAFRARAIFPFFFFFFFHIDHRPAAGHSATAAFLAGFRAAWRSVMAYVLIGTYIGIAALAHDFGFSLWWLAASTVLVWAGPAQVILVSALGAGATPVETALAVA